MKDSLILIAHLLTTIAWRRSPKLTALDRFLMGFCILFLLRRPLQRAAVIIRPSTPLKFHQVLKQRNYLCNYSLSD